MEWDSHKMASRYLNRANALHPADEESMQMQSALQGRQDLLYECYMNSFAQEVLSTFLDKASRGEIKDIPKDVDEQVYRRAFMEEAEAMISELGRML